ncbi:MAG: hypothetical protein ACERKO_11095, partial [Acetanaerobacterium sp.]
QSTLGSFQCHAYAKGRCNISHSITFSRLEDMVTTKLAADFASGDFELIQKTALLRNDAAADVIETQLQREAQKLARVKEAYENGVDTLEEYRVNKAKITERIKQLHRQRPKLKPSSMAEIKKAFMQEHKGTLKTIRDDNVSPDEKGRLLRTLIDHVVFDRTKKTVRIFYYR